MEPGHARDGLRFGVAGLGRASMSMLPSLLQHPDVQMVAVADVDVERAARCAKEFGVGAYRSVAELCEDPDVEAVYVATPHQCHAEHTELATASGKHVLVEKPMALSVADCERMTAAARRSGVQLVVGHTHAADAPVALLRRLVSSGEFGQLRMMWTADYTDFLYRPRRPEELDTSLGGGVLFNQLPHQVDVVRTIHPTGSVRRVFARTGAWDARRKTEGAYTVTFDFDDGAIATLIYSGYAHFDTDEWFDNVGEMGQEKQPGSLMETRRRLAGVLGAEAEARLKHQTGVKGRADVEREIERPRPGHPHFGVLVASLDDADLVQSPGGVKIYSNDGVSELAAPRGESRGPKAGALDELVAAVGGAAPLHDGAWGTASLRVCLAALASARWGEPIDPAESTLATPASIVEAAKTRQGTVGR